MFRLGYGLGLLLVMMGMASAQRISRGEPLAGADEESETGIRFQLREGTDSGTSSKTATSTRGATLSAAEINAVLKRLPPFQGEVETKPFALRDRSRPAPRTGKTVNTPFPPPVSKTDDPPGADEGPLEILRYAPEGEVATAANVSITFSQAMVPLTAHDDLDEMDLPVTLKPRVAGRWRWVGSQTLVFESLTRLPMATQYEVEVTGSAVSQSGSGLTGAHSWQFSTPPPKMIVAHPSPNVTQSRDPLILVAFDQKIEPEEAVRHLRIQAGSTRLGARLATKAEVEEDTTYARWAERYPPNHWFALKAAGRLPAQVQVEVVIEAGFPSAEGPLTTQSPQSFRFRTFGPLTVQDHRCGWRGTCQPLAPWTIVFSNPLNTDDFRDEWLTVEPAVEGLNPIPMGNVLTIQGRTQGRTRYRVTLDPRIEDLYGQELGKSAPLAFEVGEARPSLYGTNQALAVLDPAARGFPIYSINHEELLVRVYAVGPQHWSQYADYMRHRRRTRAPLPGKLIFDEKLRPDYEPDRLIETQIELKQILGAAYGQCIVHVLPAKPPIEEPGRGRIVQEVISWVQLTEIALDAFVDSERVTVWASSLRDGATLANHEIEVFETGKVNRVTARGRTDAEGLFTWKLPQEFGAGKLLVARHGDDVAILPEASIYMRWDRGQWHRKTSGITPIWYSFDDRGMYRPGETVHFKGWLRLHEGSARESLQLPGTRYNTVAYEVRDARNSLLTEGNVPLSRLGGFDFSLELPDNANLGSANVIFRLEGDRGARHYHAFQIQEFRRPEYEVKVAETSSGPYFAGETVALSAQADYFAGGALAQAGVRWLVQVEDTAYRPPLWDTFEFGHWVPWWREIPTSRPRQAKSLQGATDGRGRHHLQIDVEAVTPPIPKRLQIEAAVRDANQQEWKDSTQLLIHPSAYYVGLRSSRHFVEKGAPFAMETVVVDLDGNIVAGVPIEIDVVRMGWKYRNREWQEVAEDPQSFRLTSGKEPLSYEFQTKEGGTYRIVARVRDGRGQANETLVNRWVSGGNYRPAQKVERERVELIPNRERFQPGDRAEILVRAPFFPAEGVLTLRRSGLVSTRRFRMTEATHTLEIPIEDDHVPNVHVQVDLVGAAPRLDAAGRVNETLPPRPAFAGGTLNLAVPALKHALHIDLEPEHQELEPGGETTIAIQVSNADGAAAAGAEVALVVVDEAVLALSGYRLADPLAIYFPQRDAGVNDHFLREHVLLADPERLIDGGAAVPQRAEMQTLGVAESAVARPMAQRATLAQDAVGEAPSPIAMRSDFNPLAAFLPGLRTDGSGRVEVRVSLPENLTRYRIMAVAVSGSSQFGVGEAPLVARLPLMVRPSPPRFLNFGDRFELPVQVHNQTDKDLEIMVAARARNAVFKEDAGQRIRLGAGGRAQLPFPLETLDPGHAHFQVAAVAGDLADAASFQVPVWTPATTEAFATYGELDEGVLVQPVRIPEDAYSEFGGLEITTASTAVQALTDAVVYLGDYPFQGTEHRASRILAIVGLQDILEAFDGPFDAPSLTGAVTRDLEALQRLQNPDGGFGFWRTGESSWPFISVHVAHALARARLEGFVVPESSVMRVQSYLKHIQRYLPKTYTPQARFTVGAYALWVRQLLNDADPGEAARLLRQMPLDKAPLEGLGWLLPLVTDDEEDRILRHLGNRVSETAATATFTSSYGENQGYLLLHSGRRDDGVLLDALIRVRPQSDLIPKLARGLLGSQTQGRWGNTQENVFILLAMKRYFLQYENQDPDLVARTWLGQGFAGEQRFVGRTTESQFLEIPMTWLAEQGSEMSLTLAHEGSGRLYYRLGMKYAPASLELEPRSHGFFVERTYEAVDDPAEVRQEEDGSWRIKLGATVRVKLTLVSPSRRYHVALTDPLPAGLEALNPTLAVTPDTPVLPGTPRPIYRIWWPQPWFQHQNLRDERAEAFTTQLAAGVHDYSYTARATTAGEFVVPPPKVEEMYHPETFARGATDHVVVR